MQGLLDMAERELKRVEKKTPIATANDAVRGQKKPFLSVREKAVTTTAVVIPHRGTTFADSNSNTKSSRDAVQTEGLAQHLRRGCNQRGGLARTLDRVSMKLSHGSGNVISRREENDPKPRQAWADGDSSSMDSTQGIGQDSDGSIPSARNNGHVGDWVEAPQASRKRQRVHSKGEVNIFRERPSPPSSRVENIMRPDRRDVSSPTGGHGDEEEEDNSEAPNVSRDLDEDDKSITFSPQEDQGSDNARTMPCQYASCTRNVRNATKKFCRRHGEARRCRTTGCNKVDVGGGSCRKHGGGRRCGADSCLKTDVGGGFCVSHGGGKRCQAEECAKGAQAGGIFCKSHGGGRRCRMEGCMTSAQSGADILCIKHGGGKRCLVSGCRKLVRKNNRCTKHASQGSEIASSSVPPPANTAATAPVLVTVPTPAAESAPYPHQKNPPALPSSYLKLRCPLPSAEQAPPPTLNLRDDTTTSACGPSILQSSCGENRHRDTQLPPPPRPLRPRGESEDGGNYVSRPLPSISTISGAGALQSFGESEGALGRNHDPLHPPVAALVTGSSSCAVRVLRQEPMRGVGEVPEIASYGARLAPNGVAGQFRRPLPGVASLESSALKCDPLLSRSQKTRVEPAPLPAASPFTQTRVSPTAKLLSLGGNGPRDISSRSAVAPDGRNDIAYDLMSLSHEKASASTVVLELRRPVSCHSSHFQMGSSLTSLSSSPLPPSTQAPLFPVFPPPPTATLSGHIAEEGRRKGAKGLMSPGENTLKGLKAPFVKARAETAPSETSSSTSSGAGEALSMRVNSPMATSEVPDPMISSAAASTYLSPKLCNASTAPLVAAAAAENANCHSTTEEAREHARSPHVRLNEKATYAPPVVAPPRSSPCCGGKESSVASMAGKLTTPKSGSPPSSALLSPNFVSLSVEGMMCMENCGMAVQRALGAINGVRNVTIHFPTRTASVQIETGTNVALSSLTSALDAIGFNSTCIAASTTEGPLLEESGVNAVWAIATALGLVDRGCAMAWGATCNCGDNCKCVNCPQHMKKVSHAVDLVLQAVDLSSSSDVPPSA